MKIVSTIAVVLLCLTLFTGIALAKPQVELSYQLYSFDDGSFVVDYIVPAQHTGGMDVAVKHQCSLDGQVVQEWTNRVYWEGKGNDKEGHFNIGVQPEASCSAIVVDLDNDWLEVSDPVSYVVQ